MDLLQKQEDLNLIKIFLDKRTIIKKRVFGGVTLSKQKNFQKVSHFRGHCCEKKEEELDPINNNKKKRIAT